MSERKCNCGSGVLAAGLFGGDRRSAGSVAGVVAVGYDICSMYVFRFFMVVLFVTAAFV